MCIAVGSSPECHCRVFVPQESIGATFPESGLGPSSTGQRRIPPMTPEAVLKRVEFEIAGQWDRPTSHGMNLRNAVLRPPRHVIAQVPAATGGIPRNVWMVMVEHPEDESGYWVFFDPEDDCFGLALPDVKVAFVLIGTYGTLWQTLEGM